MNDPHANQPVRKKGTALEKAAAAVVLIHGRGASAENILALATELDRPRLAYLAPQATANAWYPQRFLAPTSANQPWLDSALSVIDQLIIQISAAGIPTEKVVLLGFSQGACLAVDYAARNARRYGAVIGLSGGLIGADGEARHDRGDLDGTPVFLGCSDVDFHIPLQRVHYTAQVLQTLGGQVDTRFYPGMGHTINQDEIEAVQFLLDKLTS